MKSLRKLMLIMGLLSPMLLGAQCTTDIRDALVGGALDYVSGTTQSLLEQLIFPGQQAE